MTRWLRLWTFHPVNRGSIPAVMHISHRWRQEGHLAKTVLPCARKIPFTRGHQLAFVTMQCARRQKFVCDGSTSDIATLNAVLSLSRLTGCNTERLSVKYDEYDLLCIEKARCIFRGADKHFNCVNYT